MAKDTRSLSGSRGAPRRNRPRSCVWWFLVGALFGSFGVGLYWMLEAPALVPAPVAAIPKAERPAPPEPSFQFPGLLKDTVVDTKDVTSSTATVVITAATLGSAMPVTRSTITNSSSSLG